ncbi:PadR family transcriptional regulator [Sphaerotilus hippei]|uniref:PadR family transcriptional regulator n=1 Tax=Sphaerotilus hippei TaxID=744406 RepID=A0A318GVR0_9BURK|nr:PadR family transcriptional regulator [Sphaerotilus hippei]
MHPFHDAFNSSLRGRCGHPAARGDHRHARLASPAGEGGGPAGPVKRHGGGHRGGGHGGHGGRGPRLFEQGALKLLALHLLAGQPRHGYEIIKAIEQLVGGDYSPSPGVIYPTLTYLADVGWANATEQEGGRKQYAITPAGQEQLASQRTELAALLQRLGATRQEAGARGAPEIQRAMGNLKMALQMRFAQGTPDQALVQRVAELIDQAAVGIERL